MERASKRTSGYEAIVQRSAVLIPLGMAALFATCAAIRLAAADAEAGFSVPADFAVTQFADDALAHDVFSMTIDPQGRIVVSGPGYIKILHDDDSDGVADRATLYSELPKSGAQGLCFFADKLLATGDGALLQFTDTNQDDVADAPPATWAKMRNPEHGAHAIVQGPDGWFYVVCGNDTGIAPGFIQSPRSPITDPRCGCIVRISPDGRRREVVAHGFRNPYDLGFTADGNLITVDSDGERDQHLPWYEPTRMFDVAQGMEHGWLDGGWTKSWSRPEYFFDNVDRVCEFGRGSPTGLTVYRHRQFPKKYRGGVFTACWTFGRVYFVPLEPSGSTIKGTPEIFAATLGNQGFAPVDLAVSPAGDLFVAIGGRKTRGGVYRISRRDAGPLGDTPLGSEPEKLDAVLAADQPLSSWSRARWEPIARELGQPSFEAAVLDTGRPVEERLRAIEVLVEFFGGLSIELGAAVAGHDSPRLQARAAWGLARSSIGDGDRREPLVAATRLLDLLTRQESLLVQRAAWEALSSLARVRPAPPSSPDWMQAMCGSDRRVRAAMLAYRGPGRYRVDEGLHLSPWYDAALLRIGAGGRSFPSALHVFVRADDAAAKLEGIRLMQRAMGDIALGNSGSPEGIPGYRAGARVFSEAAEAESVAKRIGGWFPDGDRRVDRELARTLALLGAASEDVAIQIAQMALAEKSTSETLHYLFVLERLRLAQSEKRTRATAEALASLHGKLAARLEYASRNWGEMVSRCLDGLIEHDPQLAAAIVAAPNFGQAEHVLFLAQLPETLRPAAAKKLFVLARDSENPAAWTPELIATLRKTPPVDCSTEELIAALRPLWDDFRLRDEVALWLAQSGNEEDHSRLIEALSSSRSDVVQAVAKRLIKRPTSAADRVSERVAVLTALRRASSGAPRSSDSDATKAASEKQDLEARLWQQGEPLRGALGDLLRHWTGHDESSNLYDPWLAWFREAHPEASARLTGATGVDAAAWSERLETIDWSAGDVSAGQRIFEKQSCHRCHRGDNRLGPDLAGAVARMTRDDLFAALYDPQREVAPPYRTTLLATKSGQVYHGLVIYESPDGTLLQTTPDTTVRVTGDDLLTMQPSEQSLMPNGLLDGLSDKDLSDLNAYLATLKD